MKPKGTMLVVSQKKWVVEGVSPLPRNLGIKVAWVVESLFLDMLLTDAAAAWGLNA